jgi:predicted RNase H-like HicB family nuclease
MPTYITRLTSSCASNPSGVAVGQDSPEAARRLIHEAINVHIAGLIEDGLPVPEPTSRAEYVEVSIS